MTEPVANETASAARSSAGLEWFTRREALASAHRDGRALSEQQRTLYERACGALAAAERVAPTDDKTVPFDEAGDDTARSLLAMTILRDAVAWALAADQVPAPTSIAHAWSAGDTAAMLKAAGSADALARARRVVVEHDALGRSESSAEELAADLDAIRSVARALVDDLARRANRVARVQFERWTRTGGGLVALIALLFAAKTVMEFRRPDLATTARWTASSADLGWSQSAVGRGGTRGSANLLFHTREEVNPWIEFDLGRPTDIHNVLIENRADCCQERATPLVLESSDDRRQWVEVARRGELFGTWDPSWFVALHARYVRARALRRTVLHLERVEIH